MLKSHAIARLHVKWRKTMDGNKVNVIHISQASTSANLKFVNVMTRDFLI